MRYGHKKLGVRLRLALRTGIAFGPGKADLLQGIQPPARRLVERGERLIAGARRAPARAATRNRIGHPRSGRDLRTVRPMRGYRCRGHPSAWTYAGAIGTAPDATRRRNPRVGG